MQKIVQPFTKKHSGVATKKRDINNACCSSSTFSSIILKYILTGPFRGCAGRGARCVRSYVYYAIPTFSPSTFVSGQSNKSKTKQKKLQILLGGTKVFDYVLICLKKLKR